MKITDIKPNESNPRIIKDDKFKKLVKSLEEFPKMMELRPIVVDEDKIILGGNMRYQALKELGYKEIPDEWVKNANDLTEEEKKEFIIKDNVGFGEWEWEILANEWEKDELIDWGLDIHVADEKENTEKDEDNLGIYPLSIILNSFEYKKFNLYKKENGIKSDTDAFKELFNAKNESNSI